jgi:HAD superfamily hydrolase (TIGR01549 family)
VSEQPDVVIFDFDGTLIDSDEALLVPFDQFGIPRAEVVMGSPVAEECDRLGISMEEYIDAYDTESVPPFDGVAEMLARIPRWAILSNKHPAPARRELERLGWEPELVMCADTFDWQHKALEPMLDALGVGADRVALVGDSDGDLQCALAVGCRFLWAGWNERVRARRPEGEVAATPADVLSLLGFD